MTFIFGATWIVCSILSIIFGGKQFEKDYKNLWASL
jgi:hypothetical protein